MFAQVIVDIPHVETDRPFDYSVPPDLQPWISIGSRVSVPFGSRSVQGYVVRLTDVSQVKRVKPITAVLDIIPPLTTELVDLGQWLSETYVCRLYSSYQAMLPAALRSNYKKHISLTENGAHQPFLLPGEKNVVTYLREKGEVEFDKLLKLFPSEGAFLAKALKEGWMKAEYVVKDKITHKTVTILRKAAGNDVLTEGLSTLPKQAARQREVLEAVLPLQEPVVLKDFLSATNLPLSSVKALVQRGWLETIEVEERRNPYAGRQGEAQRPVRYTEDQEAVIGAVDQALHSGAFASFLLHGVTGSGKTEVYLEAIARCLKEGREAIVLVPEISLTPQMVNRFKGRFGNLVAVLHSRLSHGERYDEWRMIREGRVSVVVGARSAIFAPFEKLGLIIIDEEHEGTYKQEETPRYHARDVALQRARLNNGVVILGSATPSLESFYSASRGKTGLLVMPCRVGNRPLPPVSVVDMRDELRAGNRTMFSRQLSQAIQQRLERGEQMVLFLNRRGYSTFVMCHSCGYSLQCPRCDISLTYHRHNQTVRCHYCGHTERGPQTCPSCGSEHIRFFGTGTQKVEEELSRHFPGIRIIRMDVDTTSQKGSHEKLLGRFREGKADVLLGTQMIAKGLDFPRVTLVGVIAADTILGIPDFRAAERTFQLLTQVGGRAGRHELEGEVIIQSYNPDHYSIQLARHHDYNGFFSLEAKHRYEKSYPPFYRLILFTFASENVPLVVKKADEWGRKLRQVLPSGAYVLGPVASPVPRIKDRYRFQCMVKYRNEPEVLPIVRKMAEQFEAQNKVEDIQLTVDVDPQMLM